MSQIKTFMSWNGHPKQVSNSVIKQLDVNRSCSRLTSGNARKKIWLDLPYNGKQAEHLVTSLKKIKTLF